MPQSVQLLAVNWTTSHPDYLVTNTSHHTNKSVL